MKATSPNIKYMYPGSKWADRSKVDSVIIVTSADLDVVRFHRQWNGSSGDLSVEAFLVKYEPIQTEADDINTDIVEDLTAAKDSHQEYQETALAVVRILMQRDKQWWKNPKTTMHLLRLSIESLIALEMGYPKRLGKSEELVIDTVRTFYRELSEIAKILQKDGSVTPGTFYSQKTAC